MVQRLGDAYAGVLADYHRLLRAGLAVHGGEEVVIQGDGVFAVFASPRACVDAAIRVQRALMSHAWPAGERVRVRMSVHSGEAAEAAAETAAGLEVRRAARIAAVAHGDQVVVAHRSKTRPQRSTGGSGAKLIGPSQRYRATPQRIHLDFNHADQARQQPPRAVTFRDGPALSRQSPGIRSQGVVLACSPASMRPRPRARAFNKPLKKACAVLTGYHIRA